MLWGFFILCFLFVPYFLFSYLTGIRTKNVFVFLVSSLFSVLSQISAKMFGSFLYGGMPSGFQVCIIFFNTLYFCPFENYLFLLYLLEIVIHWYRL